MTRRNMINLANGPRFEDRKYPEHIVGKYFRQSWGWEKSVEVDVSHIKYLLINSVIEKLTEASKDLTEPSFEAGINDEWEGVVSLRILGSRKATEEEILHIKAREAELDVKDRSAKDDEIARLKKQLAILENSK